MATLSGGLTGGGTGTASAAVEIFELSTAAGVTAYTVAAIPSQDSSGDYRLSATLNGVALSSSDYALSFGASSTTITLSLSFAIEAGEVLVIQITK